MASELNIENISPSQGIVVPDKKESEIMTPSNGSLISESGELKYYNPQTGWISLDKEKDIIQDGLAVRYDFSKVASFRGVNFTNSGNRVRDYTGTGYAQLAEWASTTLIKTYRGDVETPIGVGATEIEQSTTSGFQALTRWGGGSESGYHWLSAYVYPLNVNGRRFAIGLLSDNSNSIDFNLNDQTIGYNGGIQNRDAFIETFDDFPGWYRIVANFEGRSGGWVGCLALGTTTGQFAATAGAAGRAYITGIQYEPSEYGPNDYFGYDGPPNNTRARGVGLTTHGGFTDISGILGGTQRDATIAGGMKFDKNDAGGAVVFNGSDTYADLGTFFTYQDFTISMWVKAGDTQVTYADIFDNNHTGIRNFVCQQNATATNEYAFGAINANGSSGTGNFTLTAGEWTHLTFTWDGMKARGYKNGTLFGTGAAANKITYDAQNLRIGGWYAGGRNWNGKYGSIEIYERSLSDVEVLYNYNVQRNRFGV